VGDVDTDQGIEGIDAPGVTGWFAEHVPHAEAPLRFTLIAGGHSNLTYEVEDRAGARWVLRRPPLGHVLATAHDMGREHRIISALGPTSIPVPPVEGLCTDDAVNGAPFYVMGWVDGHVVRDAAATEVLAPEARRHAGEQLADVLADIHAVDVDAVGLGDLGRRDGYLERQLNRWYVQFQKAATREVPMVDRVHERLAAAVPAQGPAAIVHGDYRLDNCMVGPDGTIRAVLDWELCTLGDPLADLGLLLVYWGAPDEPPVTLVPSPTTRDGFPTRAEVVARYAERSGRDVSHVDYYVAFGYWKLACIVEGVYTRYVAGAMGARGGDPAAYEGFAVSVERLAAAADATLDGLAGHSGLDGTA
jgi:aminoglycoside phosphotransferase (APT) family kinase protein